MTDAFHFGYAFNDLVLMTTSPHKKKNVHAIWEALTSPASVMALEDVYDMDAIGLFIVPHQTRH